MHRCLLTFVVENALQSFMVTMFIGLCQVLAKNIKGVSLKLLSPQQTADLPCTFPFVEERQTLAHFKKLFHPTVESAQVLSVNLRKINERGFFFEFALSLKLEKLSRSLLRLYHDGYKRKRDVGSLVGVFINNASQLRRDFVRSMVINLKRVNGSVSRCGN